jgi:hypothetical protein
MNKSIQSLYNQKTDSFQMKGTCQVCDASNVEVQETLKTK